MPMQWFYLIDEVESGPHSAEKIAELAKSGQLKPTDFVRNESEELWVPAGRVKGLTFGNPVGGTPSERHFLTPPPPPVPHSN
jgi:GYF domain 2